MFVILEPVRGAQAGKPGARRRRDRRPSCASSSPRSSRRAVGRLRRPAGRRPGQHRRLQAAGAGPPRRRAARRCKARVQNLAVQGNQDPRPGRPVQQLQRQPAAALRRHRPREGQEPEGLARRRSTRRSRPTSARPTSTTSRFQNRNWQVNVQADPRYRLQVEDIGALEVRNADGDRVPLRTLINDPQRPPARRSSTTTTSTRRPRSTATPRPASAPARRSPSWTSSPPSSCPSTMGFEWTELTLPADPGRQGPARPSSSSRWRWCSCSWCWRRSTKAGRCRWRSS